jgi:hypothetical protein
MRSDRGARCTPFSYHSSSGGGLATSQAFINMRSCLCISEGSEVATRTWPCADETERVTTARLRPQVTMRRASDEKANRSSKDSRTVDVSAEPGERGISLLDDTLRVAAGGDKTRARRTRSNGSQWLRGNARPIATSPTQRGFADIIVFLASDRAGFIAVAT